MAPTGERPFPPGHPLEADHDSNSPEAIAWRKRFDTHLGEPAYHDPVSQAHAERHLNTHWVAGVDPEHPELEQFTGRPVKPPADLAAAEHVTDHDRAVAMVKSHGYSDAAALEIVDREGTEHILTSEEHVE